MTPDCYRDAILGRKSRCLRYSRWTGEDGTEMSIVCCSDGNYDSDPRRDDLE